MTLGGWRRIDTEYAGLPCQLLRGRRVRALGRQSICRARAEWEVAANSGALDDAFGVVWQWTRSAYSPYPGYRAGARRARRIQRQVHGQPDGVARLVARDARRVIRGRAIAISFIPRRAGNSPACGSPNINTEPRPSPCDERHPMSIAVRKPRPATPSRDGATCSPPMCSPAWRPSRNGCRRNISTIWRARRLFERITAVAGILSDRAARWRCCASTRRRSPRCFRRIARWSNSAPARAAKARILLGAAATVEAYVPVDISGDFLQHDAAQLRRDFPHLEVHPVVADFTKPFKLPAPIAGLLPRVGFFPGSTIGNFEPHEAAKHSCATPPHSSAPARVLIVGVDLVKDPDILAAAYNDAAGVTAKFNLNLLARINRELGGNFDLVRFSSITPATISEQTPHRNASRQHQAAEGSRLRQVVRVPPPAKRSIPRTAINTRPTCFAATLAVPDGQAPQPMWMPTAIFPYTSSRRRSPRPQTRQRTPRFEPLAPARVKAAAGV